MDAEEKKMTDKNQYELQYHDITTLYDLAEELVDTVDSEYVAHPDAQLGIIEPLVEDVSEAADVLSEEFLLVAGKSHYANRARKNKIETAMRRIYAAIDAYQERIRLQAQKTSSTLRNIADPIVERIKRQVETIVAIFVDFVDVSLDRIMHKTHMEELRRRQEKIALMLHNAGLGFEHQ